MIVLLWLEGPLQAWGCDSRFSRRDTLPFPTRSGVLGLLCCAWGRGGEQREWLASMLGRRQSVVAYGRTVGDVVIKQPLLHDFHMIGSGYSSQDKWQDMLIPKKSDGGRPVGAGTKMTHRYYLQDMAFACAVEIADQDVDAVGNALRTPVWDVSLGSRACAPTDIIYRGFHATERDALAEAERIAAAKHRKGVFGVVDGAFPELGDVMTLNDVPLCLGIHKRYRDRQVTVVPPDAVLDRQECSEGGCH